MISVIHGIVLGEHVHDVLERILPIRGQDWVAVVRSIDSDHATAGLTEALRFHRIGYDVISGNVCLSMETLHKAVSEGVFTGFDEVWIVSGNPPAFDLAALPSATSDGTDFSVALPDELPGAMEDTNCILIIGDGCGLNYATIDEQLRKEIVKGEFGQFGEAIR